MSEGAANEARVVISTDWGSFREFLDNAKKGLGDVKDQGKAAAGGLQKDFSDFARFTLGGTLMGMGKELVGAITAPLHRGLQEIIADAEKFRTTITGVAVSAGQDIKNVGKELTELSKKIGEDVAQVNAFVEGVRGQTGNRKAALAAVQGAKGEALARGYGSVAEMSGEVGQLQRRYKIADVEKFYNQERSRSSAMGLDPNLAAETARRMREQYEGVGMSAEGVGRFSNALLKASGGDMQMALKAGQEFSGLVQGPESRGYLERTLGLKQGALLDERGRPDVARAIELMQKFQKGKRGQKGLEFIARQHMSPTTADLFSRHMDEIASASDAQRYVEPGTPLQDVNAAYYGSDEGKAAKEKQRVAADDRAMGDPLLRAKDKQRGHAGGWGGWIRGKLWSGLGVGVGGTVAGKGLAALGLAKGGAAGAGGVAAGGAMATAGSVLAAGAGGYLLGSFLDDQLGMSDAISDSLFQAIHGSGKDREEMRNARYKREAEAVRASGSGPTFWRPTGSASSIPLGGPGFTPGAPASPWADPKQAGTEQGKALASTLQQGQGIPVTIRGPVVIEAIPPARAGQGRQ